MSVTTSHSEAVELPRKPEKYRLTDHARNRFRENERMVNERMINGSVIRMAIEEGEIEPAKEGASKFVITFGALIYSLIVANKPGADGIRDVITMYPNRR